MRILLIGQQAFGSDVLVKLVEQGEKVVGVITGPPRGTKVDPVAEQAAKFNLPCLEAPSLKGEQVGQWVAPLKPDLFCLAFVDRIVPPNLLALAPLGGINYHPSLLPRYRGGSAMHWAILAGEEETGVTIHYIDEGIDSGDIILQEKVPIDPHDSVKTLYFQKLYPLGVTMMARGVKLIREGRVNRHPQDHSLATFDPLISEEHVQLTWQEPVELLYRRVRAGDPFPGAVSSFRGGRLKVWAGRPVEQDAAGQPGEVVAVVSEGFVVKCGDGCFRVERVQLPTSKKISAVELVQELGMEIGEILGT